MPTQNNNLKWYLGCAGDYQEGTSTIPFDAVTVNDRTSNEPGYFDYGALAMMASSGPAPTQTTTAAAPLLFVSYTSVLDGAHGRGRH